MRLYKLPADQRNAHAQFNLGVLWEQGRGGLSKDDREAARLYQLAASSRINLARRWQACASRAKPRTCSRYRAAHFEGELTALRSYRPWWRRLIALAALAPSAANAPASLTISSVSRIWLRNSIMGVGAHRDHCGEDQCRNMRLHLALRDTRGSVAVCDTAA